MATQSFDIGKGIFWFFIRFGERPAGALWLMLFQTLCVLALMGVGVVVMGPAYLNLFELIGADATGHLADAEAARLVLDVMMPFLTYGVLIVPVTLLLAVMFQAAWLRFLTKGEIKPVIPLRLGGDELRLIGVNLLYLAVAVMAYFGIVTVLGLFGFGAIMMAQGGGDSAALGVGAGLLIGTGVLGVLIGLVILGVRLASAPALTVLDGRLRFFESWEASKGVFWALLASYVVVYVLMGLVGGILGVIVQLILLAAFLPMIIEFVDMADHGRMADPDAVFASLQSSFTEPGTIVAMIAGFAVLYAIQVLLEGIWHSVGAYNAVRVRSSGEGEAGDAPVLGKDHPMGASPSEG